MIRHPWEGKASCDISEYQAEVRKRQEREAQQLANITGWDIGDIRGKIPFPAVNESDDVPWWKRLWG